MYPACRTSRLRVLAKEAPPLGGRVDLCPPGTDRRHFATRIRPDRTERSRAPYTRAEPPRTASHLSRRDKPWIFARSPPPPFACTGSSAFLRCSLPVAATRRKPRPTPFLETMGARTPTASR